MEHRGYLPREEREVRSRLAKIVHRKPFIRGSIVKMDRRCGKRNCWCAKEKNGHSSYYLAARVGTKRKLIYIPRKCEERMREWVGTYKQMNKGINNITQWCIKRLIKE